MIRTADLRRFLAREFPDGTGDWACILCRPTSDMLVPGFRCIPHEAARMLADSPERCAFVYTSHAPDWRDGIPCPFSREQHPLLHDWIPVVDVAP